MILHMLAVANPRFVFRSAATGRFVSRWYALTHPRTTYRDKL